MQDISIKINFMVTLIWSNICDSRIHIRNQSFIYQFEAGKTTNETLS